jgi:hypothetical protein
LIAGRDASANATVRPEWTEIDDRRLCLSGPPCVPPICERLTSTGIGREREDRRMNKPDLLAIRCADGGPNAAEFDESSAAAENIYGLNHDPALTEKETVST